LKLDIRKKEFDVEDNASTAILGIQPWRLFMYDQRKNMSSQLERKEHDPVNSPSHYTSSPSGIECIQVTEHLNFCIGNAIKYLWRAGLKSNQKVEDLRKAKWYIEREIEKETRNPHIL
jgi:hypothetical protein